MPRMTPQGSNLRRPTLKTFNNYTVILTAVKVLNACQTELMLKFAGRQEK